MATHMWGSDFDFMSLNLACDFFASNLQKYGRIQITGCKEKYGTMRLEWFFWDGHYQQFVHSAMYPGWLYIQYPRWMYKVDWFITAIANKSGLSWCLSAYQRLVFNIVTVLAVKKWPHLKDEILEELDFDTLLYSKVKKYLNYKCNWVSMTNEDTNESK